ncbi:TKL family protein kinase [Tritrichomonas foetus]|uniref:TKL family protein kinase n=1 Tax=Tritrichomonas foetus TaxID=1144522 RepID=A0A1J4JPM6_9EUKA|nr:TKL family protein kinase [Tritrichomonas foetus]|eukprot:OHT00979.1 TKL family protein kinase [Tritrichomonas foetus]
MNTKVNSKSSFMNHNILSHDTFGEGIELICARISAVIRSNPPPYIHCSKINTFLTNLKSINTLLQSNHFDAPKRLNMTIRGHFHGIVSVLEQFQQIHTHCCRDTCAQFALTTSMRNIYNEFVSMRKEARKHFDALGLSEASTFLVISEEDLMSQNEVDTKRVSIIIKQLKRRKDVKNRPDVLKHLENRTASLTDLGISLEDEDNEIITVPELPPSLNFVLQFDDLEFGKMIGSGQSGRVFQGKIKSTGEDVAIKVLHTRILSSSDLDMFRKEIFTMAVLSHPMLVKFRGYTADSPFCIVTEYMSNGSLYDFLKQKGKELTPTERTLIALDVARGMEYLHSRGIIHRDLKSLNVLLDSKKRAKIGDFGLSKIKSSAPMTGLIGTTLWMAPEVLLSTPFYDEKVDVYSFGILLWELLTGCAPYNNEVTADLTVQIVEYNLRPPIPEDTPESLKSLIENCWEAQPSNRPTFHQIVTCLSDPAYQIPGSEQSTFMKEAGLTRKNHSYSSSSPLNLKLHTSFRNLSDHRFIWVSDNATRAVSRIKEAVNAGHFEHFNNSVIQLRSAIRTKDVDWGKVIPMYIEVYNNAPSKFQTRLLQIFFEMLYRPGAIDHIETDFIVKILQSPEDAIINIIMSNLHYQQFSPLFQPNVVQTLLSFSRHPQQTIRIKALEIIIDISKHKNCANLEFIHGYLNFAIRKLPIYMLQLLLSNLQKLLQQINTIDNQVIERLTTLMNIVHVSCLPQLSLCIEECFKFDTVLNSFSAQIWMNSVRNFDCFAPLFLYFKEKLPTNYPQLINALCLAAEKSENALNTLIQFCKSEKRYANETANRLPIKNQNLKLLSSLYQIFLETQEIGNYGMITLFEFYEITPYLLLTENVEIIEKLCNIYRNGQLNIDYINNSKLCETISHVFLKIGQLHSENVNSNIETDIDCDKSEEIQVAMMSLIFAFSSESFFPEFRKCVSLLFHILKHGNDYSALPSFLCLCVLSKYGIEGFDLDLLALKAARFIHIESQFSQDAAKFALNMFSDQISNHNEVVNIFFQNIEQDESPSVRDFARLLLKIAEKINTVSPSNINRLKAYIQ